MKHTSDRRRKLQSTGLHANDLQNCIWSDEYWTEFLSAQNHRGIVRVQSLRGSTNRMYKCYHERWCVIFRKLDRLMEGKAGPIPIASHAQAFFRGALLGLSVASWFLILTQNTYNWLLCGYFKIKLHATQKSLYRWLPVGSKDASLFEDFDVCFLCFFSP